MKGFNAMTLASVTARNGPYLGANSAGPFPVTFFFLEETHLAVIQKNASGTEERLSLGSAYSVAGAGNPEGGSVSLTSPLPVGAQLVILRDIPATQNIGYPEGGRFPAQSHERALDKVTMIIQQVLEQMERTPAVSPHSALGSLTVPDPEPGKVLGWNEAGDGLVNLSLNTET